MYKRSAVNATEYGSEMPVNTFRAEAKAIAVASDHIGNVSAVIVPASALAPLPNWSPISPEIVTIILLRNCLIISNAMMSTCTVSATPYQTAETPVR